MELLTVKDLFSGVSHDKGHWKNKYKDKYVYVKGYYYNRYLYNSHEEIINQDSIAMHKIEIMEWTTPLVTRILHRNHLEYADIRLICMVTYRPRISLENILRVELLDNNGNIVDIEKVGESSIPKELRGKI